MKKKKIITIISLTIICLLITIQLISNKMKRNAMDAPKSNSTSSFAIPVNVITMKLETVDNKLVKTGTLTPIKEADINAMASGKLTMVAFNLGSYVGQGAVIAKIDNSQVDINRESAILQRDQAKIEYERSKRLYESDAGTLAAMQQAKLQYESAANQVAQMSKQSHDFAIKAPISGQVTMKLKEQGEFVGPGAVLGHIVDISQLKVSVMVSDQEVYKLRLGQTVKVTTDVYPGIEYSGKVTFISNDGYTTHNFPVEITISNNKSEKLKSGSFAYVDFFGETAQPYLIIPRTALIESINNPMVYVLNEDNTVKSKQIILGKDFGDKLEVISGLEVGDKVITSGLINIRNGALVKPLPVSINVN